ncbi:PqqD family protein [Aerosakkonemataceae cyanobacterium BLCC-F154]|uniref:PqqD family protein n=1 Tax=Floridaenema fluviatile BLCC-F154 TaxID=3153640 RepID=A0ABV4Y9J3_9CYAN
MATFQSLTINKDGFVFNANTGESYTLNSCGRLVLQLLKQGQNREEIALFISKEFGITISQAERDMADFFAQLNALGLTGGK